MISRILGTLGRRAPIMAAAILALASAAIARDGQIDIRPTGAATFTINAPGSYILVDNVTMTVNLDCISITADDVDLDLNGHTLIGTGAGAGNGISAVNRNRVTVRNGAVRTFGGNGVNVSGSGFGCAVLDVSVHLCGAIGVFTGDSARVERCTAMQNNAFGNAPGIRVGNRSLVQNCISNSNAAGIAATFATGIAGLSDCTFRNNTCMGNNTTGAAQASGITASDGALIEGNTCSNNSSAATGAAIGITAGNRAQVRGNVVEANAGGSLGNGTVGVTVGVGCTVAGNTISSNVAVSGGTTGLLTGAQCTVIDNTVANNDATGSASAIGIAANISCVIERNVVDDNDGGLTSGNVTGISAQANSRIAGNTCTNHTATASGAATGISGAGSCQIIGNTCSNNDAGGVGNAIGIIAGNNSRVEGNLVDDNDSGTGAGSSAHGINVGQNSLVIGNTCTNQNSLGAAAGDSFGILLGVASVARGNMCVNNDSTGAGRAAGIFSSNLNCRAEGNTCMLHSGTTANNFGILFASGPGIVTGNTTSGNGLAGAGTGAGISCAASVYHAANLVQTAETIVGGIAGTVPGGADTLY